VTPFGDDSDVTPRRNLDDRTVELLLSGREVDGETELGALISQVRSLADGPAPAPSSALAAMLEGGLDAATLPVPTATSAVSWRRRSWALPLQFSLAGSACLALILGAAAANELPAPAQTAVANAVEAVTPLHVPRPAAHSAPAVVPTPTPTRTPVPAAQDPSPRATHADDPTGRTGIDDHQNGVRPAASPDGGPSGSRGGDDGHPRVSPSPDDLQPADKSGDGKGSGDRRKSGSGDGSGSGSAHGVPSEPPSHD
jgi:hypothetical protein